MRFGSVCSGIEAASVAWHLIGWKAAWFAEIEAFPSAVLKHHYPQVPNLGDMTRLAWMIKAGLIEAPDILCGGTPCQAFSVAGARRSLADARGNLTLTFCEIADAIDHRRSEPCVIVWENVPGVLNTKDNAFGCFLAGLAGEDDPLIPPGGKWPNAGAVFGPTRAVAWRVLDAQYFGVAQRRRRVFVVASAREGFDPAAVLFEWDGVRRDSAPSREARQEVAGSLTARAGRGFNGQEAHSEQLVTHSLRGAVHGARSGSAKDNLITPVKAFGGNNTSGPIEQAAALNANRGCHNPGDFEAGTLLVQDTTHTLRGEGFDASEDGTGRGTPLVPVAFPANLSGTQCASTENLAPSMGAANPTAVAFTAGPSGVDMTEVAPTLDCRAKNGPIQSQIGAGVMTPAMQVRRLTPRECERLQGFPDDYTLIPWRKKPASECPDGPRYKALGNSWAVPVVRWIGWRIASELTK